MRDEVVIKVFKMGLSFTVRGLHQRAVEKGTDVSRRTKAFQRATPPQRSVPEGWAASSEKEETRYGSNASDHEKSERGEGSPRHLSPFRGRVPEEALAFIMDVMESQPRSGSNHRRDTRPSG